MALFTRTKSGSTTNTRNNKTGKTSYSHSYRAGMGKNNSKNCMTKKVTKRQSRKP